MLHNCLLVLHCGIKCAARGSLAFILAPAFLFSLLRARVLNLLLLLEWLKTKSLVRLTALALFFISIGRICHHFFISKLALRTLHVVAPDRRS